MIASWERALPVKGRLLAYSADATNPILVNDLIVVPNRLLLFLGFFGYDILRIGTS